MQDEHALLTTMVARHLVPTYASKIYFMSLCQWYDVVFITS